MLLKLGSCGILLRQLWKTNTLPFDLSILLMYMSVVIELVGLLSAILLFYFISHVHGPGLVCCLTIMGSRLFLLHFNIFQDAWSSSIPQVHILVSGKSGEGEGEYRCFFLRQYLNVAMLHWLDLGYMATANCKKGRVPAKTQGFCYLRRKVLIQWQSVSYPVCARYCAPSGDS